jgi:hypothetical protein
MQLAITIDSVVRGQVYGALTSYFAGDVGADPAVFSDFEGHVAGDTLSLSIRPANEPSAGFRLLGKPRGDTLHLDTFVVGPDTLSGRGRHWMLVRAMQ